jgi:histone acetyltransferase (RNA polymerase elongator complex component)
VSKKKKPSKFEIDKWFKLIQIQLQIAMLFIEASIVQAAIDPAKLKKMKGNVATINRVQYPPMSAKLQKQLFINKKKK